MTISSIMISQQQASAGGGSDEPTTPNTPSPPGNATSIVKGFDDPIILDITGHIGVSSTSIAIGTDGNPVISYHDSINESLNLVHCNNVNCTSRDTPLTLDSTTDEAGDLSIAIGTDGNPVISYHDNYIGDLKFVHCNNVNCTSTDTPLTLDSAGHVGGGSSIAIGVDGNPVISYRYSSYDVDLKFVHCNNVNCTSTDTPLTLVSTVDVGFTSIAIGTDGNPVISYHGSPPYPYPLKFVHCTSLDCTTTDTPLTLDGTNANQNMSIAIGTDGNPVISYANVGQGSNGLKFVHCTSLDCTTTDTPLTLDSPASSTSIAIGTDGNPVISYYDGSNNSLNLVHCNNVNCTNTDTPLTLDSAGHVGYVPSIAIGADGNPVISYYGYDASIGTFLKLVHCNTPSCTIPDNPIAILEDDLPLLVIKYEVFLDPGPMVIDRNGDVCSDCIIDVDSTAVDTSTAGTYEVIYNASDSLGNEAEQVTRTVIVITATEAIDNLIFDIQELGLSEDVENDLIISLNGIEENPSDRNPNEEDDSVMCDNPDEFLDKVDSQETAGNLDATDADDLRDAAIRILDALGC